MTHYDFSTINPTDFEKLVCDLLNRRARLKSSSVSFHTFKQGKDRGIDILHSTRSSDYEIVVQVKHFINSPYSTLKRMVLNEEKQKVVAINPNSYILVTSLPLSVIISKKFRLFFRLILNH